MRAKRLDYTCNHRRCKSGENFKYSNVTVSKFYGLQVKRRDEHRVWEPQWLYTVSLSENLSVVVLSPPPLNDPHP